MRHLNHPAKSIAYDFARFSALIFLHLLGIGHSLAQSQDNPCALILQNGLYKTYKFQNTGRFSEDLKSYFCSDEFRKDLRNKQWGGSLSVVVDNAPLKLGADESDQEVNSFQQKIRSSTSFSVDQSFYDYAATAVPDVELAKTYSDCLGQRPYGLKVFPTVTGKDVLFDITYTKEHAADPMPKVISLKVINGRNVDQPVKDGDVLGDAIVISCQRDPDLDLILKLQTDRGVLIHTIPAEPAGFNRELPVGTIICSYLDWSHFQNVTANNSANPNGNSWASHFSKWAPADGREVPNSKFVDAANTSFVPDLRGVFLRGLNMFDFEEKSKVDPKRSDVNMRTRGDYQGDAFKEHQHTVGVGGADSSTMVGGGATQRLAHFYNDTFNGGSPKLTGFSGDQETRPKNVAIYYYIRIN